MSTPTTITEKLHKQADEYLRARINANAEAFRKEWFYSHDQKIEVNGATLNAYSAFTALTALAFERQCEANREKVVSAFMAKVESLGTEIEQLRESIEQ